MGDFAINGPYSYIHAHHLRAMKKAVVWAQYLSSNMGVYTVKQVSTSLLWLTVTSGAGIFQTIPLGQEAIMMKTLQYT